ncbi:MAG: PilZ domain-containing protein [Syntrophomonadaceae bacterium]|nr:PilZ domain-containing protein [Syntrophomonadaceae bacterium]
MPGLDVDAGVIGNTTWELVQSFSRAMNAQLARNQSLIWLELLILLAVVLLCLYWSRKRREKTAALELTVSEAGPLPPPSPASRRQKRSWVRVPVNLNMAYALVSGIPGEAPEYRDTHTLDLSAGGLSFLTHQDLRVNDILSLVLELDPGGATRLTARVARVSPPSADESQPRLVGVEFISMTGSETERLVQWIFKHQRDAITRNI